MENFLPHLLDCEQSLSFPRVARVATSLRCEQQAASGGPSFLSLIYIILTVPRAEDFRNKTDYS